MVTTTQNLLNHRIKILSLALAAIIGACALFAGTSLTKEAKAEAAEPAASSVQVTFHLNGHGSFAAGEYGVVGDICTREQNDDMPLSIPQVIDDVNAKFAGWSYDEAGNYPSDVNGSVYTFEVSCDLYAQWELVADPDEPGDSDGDGDLDDDNGADTDDDVDLNDVDDVEGELDPAESEVEYVTSPSTGVSIDAPRASQGFPVAAIAGLLVAAGIAVLVLRKRLES